MPGQRWAEGQVLQGLGLGFRFQVCVRCTVPCCSNLVGTAQSACTTFVTPLCALWVVLQVDHLEAARQQAVTCWNKPPGAHEQQAQLLGSIVPNS